VQKTDFTDVVGAVLVQDPNFRDRLEEAIDSGEKVS